MPWLVFALAWACATHLDAAPLRVVAFNVENGLHAPSSASYEDTSIILKRINADVVGLCELVVASNVDDRANLAILSAELGLPHSVFDDAPSPLRAGIASRFPITDVVWVNGEGMIRRIPLVRIAIPDTPHPVWVAMLHLKARHSASRSEQHQRAAELYHLRQAILTHCDVRDGLVVVMGDFNLVAPDDWTFTDPVYAGVAYPLHAWRDADGYFVPEQIFKLDARHAGPGGESYTWRGDHDFPPGALDHIMVNERARALGVASEIYDIQKDAAGLDGLMKYGPRPPPGASYGSDHLPVFADLSIGEPEPEPFLAFVRPWAGANYAQGSLLYVNARVRADVPSEEIQLLVNGEPVEVARYRDGDTIAFPLVVAGQPHTEITAARLVQGVETETVSLLLHHFHPIHPLPVVEMLPAVIDTVPAGHYLVLRARASFPAWASTEAQVQFYADGVYLGTGRALGDGTYELVWRTPDQPLTASITASASALQYVTVPDFQGYYGSAISANPVAVATSARDDVALAAGRTTFEVVEKLLLWPDAHADAIASGGRLAVFPTAAMYDRLITGIRQTYADRLWLGLTDEEEEGVWRWIDGSPLVEERWAPGEPNDYGNGEDHAHVWGGGATDWNDGSDQVPAYLLEKFPRAVAAWPVTAGGAPWSVDTTESVDGKDSAKAMTFHGQSTWREHTITGPATLRFHWRTSSEGGDTFSYAVNGVTRESISGETAWSRRTVLLPPGTHTIRWTYAKDAQGSAGADAGFLDGLELSPDAVPPGVTLLGDQAAFSVWAPNASAVSVVGDFNGWSEAPLERDAATGYWSGFVAGVAPGQEYQYLVRWPGNEDGRRKNDPRADWIRHGRSVVYDHEAFDWGDGFVPRPETTGLVYELHIGTFHNPSPGTRRTATFDDAIGRLDYLQRLGVDIIALMPVCEYETATSWGYNPAYPFAVENDYGGPDGLKRFVQAAHARGMRVQLDVVHNHYLQGDYPADGPGLLEFDGPEDIFFYGRRDPAEGHPDQPKRAATHWGPRPDFSQPEVRRYIEDNTRHWLEKYRIDGFRWDSPKNILGYDTDGTTAEPDTLLPEAKAMMTSINRLIHEEFPGRWSIAEEPNLLVAGTPTGQGFYADTAVSDPAESFDGHWQYGFHDAVRNSLRSSSRPVSALLSRVMNQSEPPPTRVVFLDNHDLAGDLNRGRRWPHRVGEGDPESRIARKKALLGAVLMMTAPGSPMLFMGQEFHATGTFSDRQPLDWSAAARHHRMFRAYRDLASLRSKFASVRSTALSADYEADDRLGIGRYWRGDDVVVVFNTSSQAVDNASFLFPSPGEWYVRLNTDAKAYGDDFDDMGPAGRLVTVGNDQRASLSLAPYSAMVLTRTPPTTPGAEFLHGFKHVDEPDASAHLVATTQVRKFTEWQNPPVTYWGPAANDVDGALTFRFDRPDRIFAGSARINLASFNFGANNRGGSSAWASRDGENWVLLLDNPAPGQTASYRTFDGPLPPEVLGGLSVWLQVRLRTTGTPLNSYSTAQFSRSTADASTNVFEVRLTGADGLSDDADNDGLPDAWEIITGVSDPDGDEDGDGISNRQEFLSGLDPRVYNPDAIVGTFNARNPVASPLVDSLDGRGRAHLQFFPRAATGSFHWLLRGVFYGAGPEGELIAGGAPLTYQANAGSYLLFAAGENADTAGVAALDPADPLDADRDGLDDRWQAHYGLNDPAGDADGDGLDNLAEFRRGSNPWTVDRTPALVGDRLPLRWNPDAPDLKMTWSSDRGRWEWVGEFPAGRLEFKFAMGPGWSGDNHGRSSTPGQTDTSGGPDSNLLADLPVAGRYRLAFNDLSANYAIESWPRAAEWREHHALPADHRWDSDTDGDGMSDLLEYALGGDPRRPDRDKIGLRASSTPANALRGNLEREWIYSWTQIHDPQLQVVPLLCPDLTHSDWFEGAPEVDDDQSGTPAGHTRMMVRMPGGTSQMFLRLRVRLLP